MIDVLEVHPLLGLCVMDTGFLQVSKDLGVFNNLKVDEERTTFDKHSFDDSVCLALCGGPESPLFNLYSPCTLVSVSVKASDSSLQMSGV